MGGYVSKPKKVNNSSNRNNLERGESGQWMTEQSKNRRWQDKVIKDRPMEGESSTRVVEGISMQNWDRIGQDEVGENRTESSLW